MDDGPSTAKKANLEEMDDLDRELYGEEEDEHTEVSRRERDRRTIEIMESLIGEIDPNDRAMGME